MMTATTDTYTDDFNRAARSTAKSYGEEMHDFINLVKKVTRRDNIPSALNFDAALSFCTKIINHCYNPLAPWDRLSNRQILTALNHSYRQQGLNQKIDSMVYNIFDQATHHEVIQTMRTEKTLDMNNAVLVQYFIKKEQLELWGARKYFINQISQHHYPDFVWDENHPNKIRLQGKQEPRPYFKSYRKLIL